MRELNRPTDVGEKAKQGFWEEFEVPDFVLWPGEGRQKGAGGEVGWVLGPLGERRTTAEAFSALPDAAAAGMPAPGADYINANYIRVGVREAGVSGQLQVWPSVHQTGHLERCLATCQSPVPL